MQTLTRNQLAPVIVFVYNRLKNTEEVIGALQKNDLAQETDVIIFSDAPKNKKSAKAVQEVRDYLKTVDGFKSFTIVERQENFYIERNIVEGVTEIINRFGKIIVLEDDGVTAKNFLTFMNEALNFYEQHEKVMHVATFTFIKMPEGFNRTFLWRYSENTGGGWGTWKRAWDTFEWFQSEEEGLRGLTEDDKNKIELDGDFKCLNTLKLKPIPWDICWYIAITKNKGLAVNSPYPLVRNNGLFNGTHFTALGKILGKHPFEVKLEGSDRIIFEDKIEENKEAISLLQKFYRELGTRKRDRILGFILKILVSLRITKLLKRILQ